MRASRSVWAYWGAALFLGFALGHLDGGAVSQTVVLALLLLNAAGR